MMKKAAKRTCPICKKKFSTRVNNQKFCNKCRENRKADIARYLHLQAHPKKVVEEQVCPICGLLFMPTNGKQKFCNPCREDRMAEIQAYQRRLREVQERQSRPRSFPSIQDINRKIESWYKKTGVKYSYGQYVYLRSIGRVP